LSRFNFGGRTKQESFHAFWWRTQPFAPYNDLKEEGVLLLDEPTNDLDINTSCLRGRFESFAGCAVLFRRQMVLDRICTHILALKVTLVYCFEGGFSEYEEKKKRLGGDLTPKRLKYRKLIKLILQIIF
jgi:ATPase subunit of ABC transporter with duplicated ATPase domains